MTASILGRLDPSQIVYEPFPHIHATECLEPRYYAELADGYPSMDKILGNRPLGNNYAYLMQAREVFADPEIPAIWRDFFAYHTSRAFFEEFVSFFRSAIGRIYPNIEKLFGKPLAQVTTEVRYPGKKGTPENRSADVMMDCQFGINSPVKTPTTVRGPHIDAIHKLFNSLLYFRHPDDRSDGGNLIIYRARTGRFHQDGRRDIAEKYVEPVAEVPYRANSLIMMLNTEHSIHGVSPRQPTEYARRYVDFHCECYNLKTDGFFPVRRTVAGRVGTAVRRLVGARDA